MVKHLAGGGIVAQYAPEEPTTEGDLVKIAAYALAQHERNLSDAECDQHARRLLVMLKAIGVWPQHR